MLDGILPNNLLAWDIAGFTVTPPEPDANNQRVFVPRQALKSIQVLGVVGSPLRPEAEKAAASRPISPLVLTAGTQHHAAARRPYSFGLESCRVIDARTAWLSTSESECQRPFGRRSAQRVGALFENAKNEPNHPGRACMAPALDTELLPSSLAATRRSYLLGVRPPLASRAREIVNADDIVVCEIRGKLVFDARQSAVGAFPNHSHFGHGTDGFRSDAPAARTARPPATSAGPG